MPTIASNTLHNARHCPHCLGRGMIDEVVVATGEIKATRPCRGYAHMAWQPRLRKAPARAPISKPSIEDFSEAMECLAALASGPSWSGAY